MSEAVPTQRKRRTEQVRADVKEVSMVIFFRKKVLLQGILRGALVCAAVLTACVVGGEDGSTRDFSIPLTGNIWAEGALTPSNQEQWFTFTATAGTHYLHVSFGTLTDLYVQVYDSRNNPVGDGTRFTGRDSGSAVLTITSGKAYYIRVSPYAGQGSGTYRIAFNTMPSPPLPPGTLTSAASLKENTWAEGAFTPSSTEQWFKFTATAATQYLHVSFGTLTDLYVQLYDRNGAVLGNRTELYSYSWGSRTYTSLMSERGQVYYVRVTPNSGSGGAYWIAFNTSSAAPQ
jgi:hypothetical protein